MGIELDHRPKESLDPRHFYAGYVFDNAETRARQVDAIIREANQLGYPVRYWWLSEAMDIGEAPDRLIVCVHHPAAGENAGMDLYDRLVEQKISWDDLDAADVGEYRQFGKPAVNVQAIHTPDGETLFPPALPKAASGGPAEVDRLQSEPLFVLTRADIQSIAQQEIGRDLTDGEIGDVADMLAKTLDWPFCLAMCIQSGQTWGRIGPGASGYSGDDDASRET